MNVIKPSWFHSFYVFYDSLVHKFNKTILTSNYIEAFESFIHDQTPKSSRLVSTNTCVLNRRFEEMTAKLMNDRYKKKMRVA